MKQRFLHIGLTLTGALLLALSAVVALAACGPATEDTAVPQQENATNAAEWLVAAHQNEDGGYSSFSAGADLAPSDAAGTLDSVQALAAAGLDPAAGETNPTAFLETHAADLAAYATIGGGPAGKVLLGLTAVDADPSDFMGYNFVISLTDHLSPTGQLNAVTPFDQSLALLGLAAVDEAAPAEAINWLKAQQADNGSWDDGYGTVDNPDATSMAIMALIAHGEPVDGPALTAARDFLAAAQLSDGSWEYGPGFGGSANSTALAIQGLSALGEPIDDADSRWTQDGVTPMAALLSFQSESGAFQTDFGDGPFDDFFTTVQAIPAVMGQTVPIR